MNLDAIGMVPIPSWAAKLKNLYWHRRMARPVSRPCLRTWQRRISEERCRLVLEEGVDPIELHLVCRILVARRDDPAGQWRAERSYVSFLVTQNKGGGLLSWSTSQTDYSVKGAPEAAADRSA